MNDDKPSRVGPGGLNPYLPTPVARLSDTGRRPVTVSTEAVRRAFDFLDPYLAGPQALAPSQTGRVLTIVGDFGTGKSHLAIALLRRAQESTESLPETVYLDAPAGSFADLYRRFAGNLNRAGLTDLLHDYYADIVAAELAEMQHTGRIAERVRSGEIDPVAVVRELNLADGELLRRQQAVLIRVTGDNDIGTALTLLLEPSTDAVVWDWLTGHPPHEFLRERGILRPIGTDAVAVHAMLAIARLYRERGRRFVVVIDEFDHVLSSGDRLEPFRHMLEAIGDSGAFVVLAGMADMLDAVGQAVQDRMQPIVRMKPMEVGEVTAFIRESHRTVRGDTELDPFRPDGIAEVTALSRGVPRSFITLLHHLYSHAQQHRVWITGPVARRVGGASYDVASMADVRREVYQTLVREGLRLTRGLRRDPGSDPAVDYWVADHAGELRCAVLVTGTMLSEADLRQVRQRVQRARAEAGGAIETVLIVAGFLTAEIAAQIGGSNLAEPIRYGEETFAATLSSVVTGILRRSDDVNSADPLDAIRYQMGRIAQQQTNLQDTVDQLAQRLTEREEAARREETVRVVPVRDGEPDPVVAAVESLFDRALERLATIERMDGSLASAFDLAADPAGGLSSGVRTVQARLQQQDGFSPLGTAIFLERLVRAFRTAFLGWYAAATAGGRQVGQADRERLDRLCTSYESLYHDIPVDELKRLVESTAREPDSGGPVQPLNWPTIRLEDVRRSFAELAVQVAREVDATR